MQALAESLLASESVGLPVAVMRPSIVAASWKEPRPGWVDNYNGPSGVFAGIGKGVLRTVYCMRDSVADMVPVDVCINLLCAIAWETANAGPGKPIKVDQLWHFLLYSTQLVTSGVQLHQWVPKSNHLGPSGSAGAILDRKGCF